MGSSCLLAAILVCVACLSRSKCGQAYDPAWEAIENELGRRNSPAENLRLALTSFADEIAVLESGVLLSPNRQRIVKRVKLLQDLQGRIEFPHCDDVSYNIRDSLIQDSRFIKYPRAQAIVLFLAYELAKACQKQHVVIFRREIDRQTSFPSEGSREFFDYIRPFFAKLIYATITQDEDSLASEDYLDRLAYDDFLGRALANPNSLGDIHSQFILAEPWSGGIKAKEARVALSAVMSLVERVKIEDRGRVERLVESSPGSLEVNLPGTFFSELIVKGCRKFLDGLGDDLFRNAQKDAKYLGYTVIEERSKTIADYYFSWASYRACWALVSDANLEFDMRLKIGQQANRVGAQSGRHPSDTTLLIYEEPKYQQAKGAKTV